MGVPYSPGDALPPPAPRSIDTPPDHLSKLIYHILVENMISHKNSAVTHRLDWCRDVSQRLNTDCKGSEEFEKQLGKAALTVIPRKVDDLYSWLVDLIVRAFDDLFRIEPTARPDLSQAMKEKAADSVMSIVTEIVTQRAQAAVQTIVAEYAQIGMRVTPEQALQIAEERGLPLRPDEQQLREIVLEVKGVTRRYENEQAAKGAKAMSTLIQDWLQHTKSLDEVMKFLHDFCIYPYGILHSGQTRTAKMRTWKNDKLVKERFTLPAVRRVSPYDFFWTKDSTDIQDGLGVAERIAMRRFDVEQLKHLKTGKVKFDSGAIDELLNDFENSYRDWLVKDENPQEGFMQWSMTPSETVDVFRIFILVSGHHLKKYHKELPRKVKDHEQFQLEVYQCGYHILGIAIHDADYERPYGKESYEPVPSDFCGNALPETLAVINAAARKGFIHLIRNMGKSTNPSVMVNREMVDYDSLDEEEVILPDNQYDFMAALGSTGKPVDLLQFPNYTGEILRFQDYLDTRADIESGIPKYALGQAAGLPSALRSTAALTLMIDNALKTIKSRVFRIGTNVIAPAVQGMAGWALDNWDDQTIKVDAEVHVRGLEGVITKSLVINKIQELLQYLAPFQASGTVSPEVIQGLVNRFMLESGIDPDEFHNAPAEVGDAANALLSQGSGLTQ